MKNQINEVKRMQVLAGIITEAMVVNSKGELVDDNITYDSEFNARKKYIETPQELEELLEDNGVELDEEMYVFYDMSLHLDDMDDEDEDIMKDLTRGEKTPNSSVRINKKGFENKKLFKTIQNLDFIDSAEKIKEVLHYYFYQPYSMNDYFTDNYYDTLEEAKEEWEDYEGKDSLMTWDEWKQLYDTYGEDLKG
jgi:hypothetical protein